MITFSPQRNFAFLKSEQESSWSFLCYVLSIIMNFQSMQMTVFSICVCMINIDLNFLYCKLNFLVPYFITLNHQMSCSIQINLNICHYGTYFQEVFYCLHISNIKEPDARTNTFLPYIYRRMLVILSKLPIFSVSFITLILLEV